MPEMRIAQPAGNLGSHHFQTAVGRFQNILLRNGRPETGPTRPGFELGAGIEQCRFTTDATEHPLCVLIWIFIREGALGTGMTRNFKGSGRELLLPLVLRFHNSLYGRTRCPLASIRKLNNGYCFRKSRRCGLRMYRLMPLCVQPSEYHTQRNGACQKGTAPDNGTWHFVFLVQSEHNAVSQFDLSKRRGKRLYARIETSNLKCAVFHFSFAGRNGADCI